MTQQQPAPSETADYLTTPHQLTRTVLVGSADHSWSKEFTHLWSPEMRVRTLQVMDDIVAAGRIIEPILVGTDGRVWDGHHRIAIATALGMGLIPVADLRLTQQQPAQEGAAT